MCYGKQNQHIKIVSIVSIVFKNHACALFLAFVLKTIETIETIFFSYRNPFNFF